MAGTHDSLARTHAALDDRGQLPGVVMYKQFRASRIGASMLLAFEDQPRLAGSIAVVVGISTLLGWLFAVELLKSAQLWGTPMKVNTAIAVVLVGLGLILAGRASTPRDRRIAVLPIAASLILAIVVGSQYLTGQNLGIDTWLVRAGPAQSGSPDPNRMAPMTVVSILLLGVGIALLTSRRLSRLAGVLVLATFVIAALDALDLLFGATAPALRAGSTPMAPGTALTLLALSIGTIGLLPDRGLLAAMHGETPSAGYARRLIVASLVVPMALAWLRLQGEARGIYGAHYGASLIVLGTFLFMAVMILWTTRIGQRTDAARQAVIEERDRFFDVSIDLLATANANGMFVRLNPAWKQVLGYDVDELMSRPFVDFVHPDDVAATNHEVTRQIDQGRTVLNFQNRYRHRDGTYRWLEWTSAPSADASRLYAVARDITERKQEEELLRAPALALARRRTEVLDRIETIIESVAFRPVYQPVVDLASGTTIGYEALTRFSDGSRPDEVFATARECGLGIELEAVTLREAMSGARRLPSRSWLSLNVSPVMFGHVSRLEAILGLRSRPLVLEITEHDTIEAYGPLRDAINQLGPDVRLAVDDAGAGVANFRHLVELRPDFVKIDISLVHGVDADVSRQAAVAGILHFAKAAGCAVIAEGIETDGELSMVSELGVGLGQGYLLGRPAPVEEWRSSRTARVRSLAGRRIDLRPGLPRAAS